MTSTIPSGAAARDPGEERRRLGLSRVLLVGLEPWGAVAAEDLADAGLGALHVLDDRPVTGDDLTVPLFTAADVGTGRAPALSAALARRAPDGSGCAVTCGPLLATADQPLALDDTRWDLVLACVPDDDLLVLQAVARFAHAARVPSISASLTGLDVVMGPGVVPGVTACWNCTRLRLLSNSRRAEADIALHASLLAARPAPRRRTCLAPTPALAGHALAHAALDWLARPGAARRPLQGGILVQSAVTLETSFHAVLPVPRCQICGGASASHPDGVAPQGNGENLDEARTPAELMRMLAGVVDARTGVVRQVIVRPSDSALDPEVPITAAAILARHASCACTGHDSTPEMGAGKGTTIVKAMISAVGEGVERYSAERFDPGAILHRSVADMKVDFIRPEDLCRYSDSQYADPDFPCVRPDPSLPMDWVRGAWLDTGEAVLVPALPTYMHYHVPPEAYFCDVTSSGLAAGPTLADAALGGALELIERDALMISWLARLPGKRVLVDASVDEGAREVHRQLAERGVRVELYLLDVGLGIPTIVCAGYGDGQRWSGATLSLSAHLSPRVAIAKALLEQGHIGPYVRRLVSDEKRPIPGSPSAVRSLEDHALYYFPPARASALAFLGGGGSVAASALPEPEEISLAALVRRTRAAGLRIAVVDVTSADLADTPFRVARAVGPGFQQIHFGHGRAHLGNPRLLAMAPQGINPDPHPMA